eukprot:1138382-Pelagomonas_calceolata.AAC.17
MTPAHTCSHSHSSVLEGNSCASALAVRPYAGANTGLGTSCPKADSAWQRGLSLHQIRKGQSGPNSKGSRLTRCLSSHVRHMYGTCRHLAAHHAAPPVGTQAVVAHEQDAASQAAPPAGPYVGGVQGDQAPAAVLNLEIQREVHVQMYVGSSFVMIAMPGGASGKERQSCLPFRIGSMCRL